MLNFLHDLEDLTTSLCVNDRWEPCFICGEATDLVDVGFEAPFCNSGICNWAIDEDLRMSCG